MHRPLVRVRNFPGPDPGSRHHWIRIIPKHLQNISVFLFGLPSLFIRDRPIKIGGTRYPRNPAPSVVTVESRSTLKYHNTSFVSSFEYPIDLEPSDDDRTHLKNPSVCYIFRPTLKLRRVVPYSLIPSAAATLVPSPSGSIQPTSLFLYATNQRRSLVPSRPRPHRADDHGQAIALTCALLLFSCLLLPPLL